MDELKVLKHLAIICKVNAKSPIFEAVHETASDLHRRGFISRRKLNKFEALCLDSIPKYGTKNLQLNYDGKVSLTSEFNTKSKTSLDV